VPTYDYVCESCGHQFEEFQSIKAKPLKKCPSCGKPKLNRLIGTGAGIIFKGSGFYATDYRSDSYKSSAKSETGSKPESKATKTESTPETKSEAKKTEQPLSTTKADKKKPA
jgi:putative FmdB family regulatory protein